MDQSGSIYSKVREKRLVLRRVCAVGLFKFQKTSGQTAQTRRRGEMEEQNTIQFTLERRQSIIPL